MKQDVQNQQTKRIIFCLLNFGKISPLSNNTIKITHKNPT